MIDINYYAMLKEFMIHHQRINDYSYFKDKQREEEYDELMYEKMNKYNIGFSQLANIMLYIKFCYIYFNDYDKSKVIKVVKQVSKRGATLSKNDCLLCK
jgi:hypothetical protein